MINEFWNNYLHAIKSAKKNLKIAEKHTKKVATSHGKRRVNLQQNIINIVDQNNVTPQDFSTPFENYSNNIFVNTLKEGLRHKSVGGVKINRDFSDTNIKPETAKQSPYGKFDFLKKYYGATLDFKHPLTKSNGRKKLFSINIPKRDTIIKSWVKNGRKEKLIKRMSKSVMRSRRQLK